MTHRFEPEMLSEEGDINDLFERLEMAVIACGPDGLQQRTAVGIKTLPALSRRAEEQILFKENEIGFQG
jgi:hypothetical protein